MPTFTEVLPATKSDPAPAIRWTPGVYPGTGKLEIQGARCCCTYAVASLPCEWDGTAARLMKFADTPGSDPESEAYSVFVAAGPGEHDRCDCKGFAFGRGKPCRHIEAVRSLVQNRWLNRAEMENQDQDVANTEIDDQPESEFSDSENSPTPAERFIRDCYPAATLTHGTGGFAVVLLGEPLTAPRPTAAAAWLAANDAIRGAFRGEGS